MSTAAEQKHHEDLAYLMQGADTLDNHVGCYDPPKEERDAPVRSCPMAEVELDNDGNPVG